MAEYIVGEQILEHFITYNLLHPKHYGSLANHYTATDMEASEKKDLTGVCMIDQSAAYDLLRNSERRCQSPCSRREQRSSERENTYQTGEMTTKERERRGEPWPTE
jgi:hypothetical protein